MILLDPELEPDRRTSNAPGATTAESRKTAREERLPSSRGLNGFLRSAQEAVRLRGLVTVLLTTDTAIRRLNRRFRGKNKATDVLSFPALDPFQVSKSRRGAPASRRDSGSASQRIIGDLAISVPTARRQAADQGHALAVEIKVLILHGLLHLAGYDHETDAGEMARRERALRMRLALPPALIERSSLHRAHSRGTAARMVGAHRRTRMTRGDSDSPTKPPKARDLVPPASVQRKRSRA